MDAGKASHIELYLSIFIVKVWRDREVVVYPERLISGAHALSEALSWNCCEPAKPTVALHFTDGGYLID